MTLYPIDQGRFARFFTADSRSAPFWLLVRLYLGYEWVTAGWEKVTSPVWFGSHAGAALQGFVQGALAKTSGAHPDVQGWYAWFLAHAVLPHTVVWSNAIALGEVAVGLGLIVGLCTATAAFFGGLMNLNYLLSGTVSINPILLMGAIGLILARRVAGSWGLDRYARPLARRVTRDAAPE
jgi:thiosulfate dehydrogenase [quinone] large subunit